MSQNDTTPPVVCTIQPEHLDNRDSAVLAELQTQYAGAEERDRGYTIIFNGVDETVRHVAEFISNELQCFSFAEYELAIKPPYDQTRLTITGPARTKTMFHEGLIDRFETENA